MKKRELERIKRVHDKSINAKQIRALELFIEMRNEIDAFIGQLQVEQAKEQARKAVTRKAVAK